MKTYTLKAKEISRKWWVVDATDAVLGRLASQIALRLRGKHKPEFTPHMDCGDGIIVINAGKVKLTGNKAAKKVFYWHTGYPGGIKGRTVAQRLSSPQPERVIEKAVQRMISRNPLGRQQMRHLKIYKGDAHPHEGQAPEAWDIKGMNSKNVIKGAA